MSLTTFVKTPRISKAFDQFATKERTPKTYKNTPLLVHDSNGPNGLAGSAFDYLARIHIARVFRNSKIKIHQRQWISEHVRKRNGRDIESGRSYWIEQPDFWLPQLDEAHEAAREYIEGRGCARCLSTQTQYMAHADLNVRTMFAFDGYFNACGRVAQELSALLALFNPEELFLPKERIILNPEFALSEKIGGADGDLIVDDRLIEFKTVKRLLLNKSYLIQLAGYAVLQDLGGTMTDQGIDRKPINSVGVYFARHNVLVELPLSQLFPGDGYQRFRAVFEDELNARDQRNRERIEAFERRWAERESGRTSPPV